MTMYGFHGRFLHVDLSTGRTSWRELEESRLQNFLGGIGLGTSLLYEFAPAGVEPLSPANPLIFTSAPLVGTGLTTTAKYAVVTKSPLTSFIADSLSSSFFALELKRVGIDALVITGRASSPVYLFIEEEKAELLSADNLWRKARARRKRLSARSMRIQRSGWQRSVWRAKIASASPPSAMKDATPVEAASAQ